MLWSSGLGALSSCGKVSAGSADASAAADACTRETDEAFCARLGASCGTAEGYDDCGVARTAACGECGATEQCGGGEANVCAAHPALTGVDGYIVLVAGGTDGYHIVPARNGAMTGEEPICCYATVPEARAGHPELNLAWLRP
jgi:hypothetical protein